MERSEVLKFLELSDSASFSEIHASIDQKLKNLDAIGESISTDFLKRMHQENVDKALAVNNEILLWVNQTGLPENPPFKEYNNVPVIEAKSAVIAPAEEQEQKYSMITTPIIIGLKSQMKNLTQPDEPVGWLVRHMENQTPVTFAIFPGKNYVGRKQQSGLTNFIIIDDVYVSRIHAVIEVEETSELKFYLSDSESSNLGKPSKNGTYIDGDTKRITQKVRLLENDTIQVGLTKMILKINRGDNLKGIIKEVDDSKFMDTVIITPE